MTIAYDGAMSQSELPTELSGVAVHMVGIKGTGMSALAEILINRGAIVTGSDTEERFYTDSILRDLGIPYREGFAVANLPEAVDVVIYSAAYDPESHPELRAAADRGIQPIVYTDALGALSAHTRSVAVSGVHGKSTTTALAGSLVRRLKLGGTVLVGCAVRDFGNRSTLVAGSEFFVAETCEYRRHFLAFHPDVCVVTSVEADHLDYFTDAADVELAFRQFVDKLAANGAVIFCADDPGAARVAEYCAAARPDVARIPYGVGASGPFRRLSYSAADGRAEFRLAGFDQPFPLALPGAHLSLNATAALAAIGAVLVAGEGARVSAESVARAVRAADGAAVRSAFGEFGGLSRRSELLGRARGVLFMDDYGHHPTEIAKTLAGLREFYAPRRLFVDFMSHTFTRTDALLWDFADAFGAADHVILHDIYASARESYDGSINGRDLADAVSSRHPSVRYFEDVMAAASPLRDLLRPGDLFVTMGAGNNWRLSQALYEEFSR